MARIDTPYELIERLLAFRDSGKLTREERDLIADACNMVSSLNWKLAQPEQQRVA